MFEYTIELSSRDNWWIAGQPYADDLTFALHITTSKNLATKYVQDLFSRSVSEVIGRLQTQYQSGKSPSAILRFQEMIAERKLFKLLEPEFKHIAKNLNIEHFSVNITKFEIQEKYCYFCGVRLPRQQDFCVACGTRLTKPVTASVPPPLIESPPAPIPSPEPPIAEPEVPAVQNFFVGDADE